MRVLFCCPPLEGFVHPMLPLATAFAAAGHAVRLATGSNAHARVREAGLAPLAAGPAEAEAAAATARLPGLGNLPPQEQWRFGVALFAQSFAPAKLADLERIIDDWRPDLVVHVWSDLAAPIAAAAAGVPSVSQGFGLLPASEMLAAAAETIAPLWQTRGLTPDPLAGAFGSLYLDPMPPSLQPGAEARVKRHQRMRLDVPAPDRARLPVWADHLGARPVVYVSLGTVPPFSQLPFFSTILQGLARSAVDVVVTVGAQNDPVALGPQPPHVHVEHWLPLPLLLPRCDVAICHAGSGTTLAALAAGLPLLLLPRGADQFQNAAACERAGVARVLPPPAFSPPTVASELELLLSPDAQYRQAAHRLRDELAAMPSAATVVPLMQDLVATTAAQTSVIRAAHHRQRTGTA